VHVLTVVGARPQFVKAWPVSRALRRRHRETLLHTGQHYDDRMSRVFFDELGIPAADVNLEVGSGSHGAQTGQMLAGIERELIARQPDWVLVYGDTNSTLAGALAAAKLHVPIAHVEAGLRSFNRAMPEEVNRVLTDHVSDRLLCPTDAAVRNLASEGLTRGVAQVGDVMYDAIRLSLDRLDGRRPPLDQPERGYYLATVHRAENTDAPGRLDAILSAFGRLPLPVVWPLHPRTRRALADRPVPGNVRMTEPFGYLDSLAAQRSAAAVLTDSGGVQKEAYILGVPCVTLRDETEWVETVEAGWNRLAGADPGKIVPMAQASPPTERPPLYGDGQAAERIVRLLEEGS
jgi:UDP-N-acetylglucosamine 2-epimerase